MSGDRMKVIFSHLNGDQEIRITVGPKAASSTPSTFQYTQDNSSKLSLAQREFYEHNGFLLVPNLVSHDRLDQYR